MPNGDGVTQPDQTHRACASSVTPTNVGRIGIGAGDEPKPDASLTMSRPVRNVDAKRFTFSSAPNPNGSVPIGSGTLPTISRPSADAGALVQVKRKFAAPTCGVPLA